jgi:hypothetical protein
MFLLGFGAVFDSKLCTIMQIHDSVLCFIAQRYFMKISLLVQLCYVANR